MKVKVCGITRSEDAFLAASLGAWALGFVFAESPRHVALTVAREIISGLPANVEKVGVFVNATANEMLNARDLTGITLFQLHGEESVATVSELRKHGARVIKAVRPRELSDLKQLHHYDAEAFLVDGFSLGLRGGTGQVADWQLAIHAKAIGPVILAGGLHSQNVGEALSLVGPYAVDASSGLESAPGMKSRDKMKSFFSAVAGPQNGVQSDEN